MKLSRTKQPAHNLQHPQKKRRTLHKATNINESTTRSITTTVLRPKTLLTHSTTLKPSHTTRFVNNTMIALPASSTSLFSTIHYHASRLLSISAAPIPGKDQFGNPITGNSRFSASPTPNDQQRAAFADEVAAQTGIDLGKFEKIIQAEEKLVDSGKAKNFFDVQDDDLSEDSMTEAEDHVAYMQTFDKENVLPEYFDPELQPMEFLVAHLLQAEVQDHPIFPTYLKRHVFNKIMKTLAMITKKLPRGVELNAEQVTTVIYDIFINFAPELCRTHEHALNILFPLAPRVGDIVELPDVIGKCVVSKREYIDNRWNDDPELEMTDKERMMVIIYDCLHPSLRGKSLRSNHPFDIQVYKLTVAQDERGLEMLMHQRGMIDMYTGRILNPEEQQVKQLQQDLKFDPKLLKGPGAKVLIQQRAKETLDPNALRLPGGNPNANPLLLEDGSGIGGNALTKRNVDEFFHQNKPPADIDNELKNKYVLDGSGVHIRDRDAAQIDRDGRNLLFDQQKLNTEKRDREAMPSFKVSQSDEMLRQSALQKSNNLYEVLDIYRQEKRIAESYPHEPRRTSKEYLRPKVLTGEAAMVMYKSLVQELASTENKSKLSTMTDRELYKENIRSEIQRSSESGQAVSIPNMNQLAVSGAVMTARGASYGPDLPHLHNPAMHFTGSTHNAPALPNRTLTIGEQRRIDEEMNASVSSQMTHRTGESVYMRKYREMQEQKRAEIAALQAEQHSMTFGERKQKEEELKSEQDNAYKLLETEFITLVESYKAQGHSHDDANAMADEVFQKRSQKLEEEASQRFLKEMAEDGVRAYNTLPEKYKKKYANIIIQKGPGSGLPDPLHIDRGEDLFDLYPNANLALMDFLSDQWTLMVQEKQQHLEKQRMLADQIQDVQSRKKQKLNEMGFMVTKDPNIIIPKLEEDQEETRLREEWALLGADENSLPMAGELIDNRKFDLPYDIELTRFRLLATIAAAGQHAFTAEYIQDIFERVMKSTHYKQIEDMVDDELQREVAQSGDRFIDVEQVKTQRMEEMKAMIHNNDALHHNGSSSGAESDGEFNINDIEADIDSTMSTLKEKQSRGKDHSKSNDTFLSKDEELLEKELRGVELTSDGYIKRSGKLYTQEEYAQLIFGKKPVPLEDSPYVPSKMRQMIRNHYAHRDQIRESREKQKVRQSLQEQRFNDAEITDINAPVSCPRDQMTLQQQQQYSNVNHHPELTKEQAMYEVKKRQEHLLKHQQRQREMIKDGGKNIVKITPLRVEQQQPSQNHK